MQEISYIEEVKRKLVHLSSLWMVAIILLLGGQRVGHICLLILFGALYLLNIVSEHSYANNGKFLGRLYGFLFGKMLRKEVHAGQWVVSGGSFVLLGAFLVTLLFPYKIAALGMVDMLIGDIAAALIGRKFGKHKINGKSFEGSFAFFLFGYLAMASVLLITGMPGKWYIYILFSAVLGAVIELFSRQLRVDDNLLVPVLVAASLYGMNFI